MVSRCTKYVVQEVFLVLQEPQAHLHPGVSVISVCLKSLDGGCKAGLWSRSRKDFETEESES